MTEIVAHCGKVVRFLLKRVTQKPAVDRVSINLLRCSAQGGRAIQVLDEHDLCQYNWVYTGPAVFFAVQQRLHHLVHPFPIYCCVNFPQQTNLWYQIFHIYHF